jgi:hypothetical protein
MGFWCGWHKAGFLPQRSSGTFDPSPELADSWAKNSDPRTHPFKSARGRIGGQGCQALQENVCSVGRGLILRLWTAKTRPRIPVIFGRLERLCCRAFAPTRRFVTKIDATRHKHGAACFAL